MSKSNVVLAVLMAGVIGFGIGAYVGSKNVVGVVADDHWAVAKAAQLVATRAMWELASQPAPDTGLAARVAAYKAAGVRKASDPADARRLEKAAEELNTAAAAATIKTDSIRVEVLAMGIIAAGAVKSNTNADLIFLNRKVAEIVKRGSK